MMNKSFNLLAIILAVFLIGFFLEETIDSSKLSKYESLEETVEIISELFSVFVALSIFAITWHAYSKSRDNHSLFLGSAFLITGLLALFHLLSYTFMPDFITPNSPHKASIFFLESRFILAFLLLASVYIQKDSFPKLINRKVMFFFSAAILSISLASVWFYHDFLFGRFNLDTYSTETVLILVLITIIILVTGFLYYKKAKETFQTNLNYLANGSIILLVSNLVYISYELSAHFLIITGFVYFYLGLYKTSVEMPYERLAISEEKLRRAAQEKYRRLFDNANDAIITIDLGGHIASWNKSAEKLFGWTFEEITGKKLFEAIVYPETEAQKENNLFKLASETVTGQETICIHKDGTKIDVSVTVSPLMDENINVMEKSLIIRDITERKQAELQYKTILSTAMDGFYITDSQGCILDVNDSYCSMTGYSRNELLNMKIEEIEAAETKEMILQRIAKISKVGMDRFETCHKCKDGRIVRIEASVNYMGIGSGKFYVFMRDITERKRFEKALFESEYFFKESQRAAFIGSYKTDFTTGFWESSEVLDKIFGIDQSYSRSIQGWLEIVYPDDREMMDRYLMEEVIAKRKPFNKEYRIIRRSDGEIRWVIGSGKVDFDNEGKIISLIGTIQDITERKQAEEKIKRSLEEKEVLLREIHHRVKNNMQVISSLLMLQSHNIEDKKYKDMFIESQTRIYSMALIHEKLYRSESIAQINFKEYIDGIVSNIFESYSIKSNIKIEINVENILIKIDYAVPCGLIINELITNSLKYAFPDGRQGKIHISLKSIDNDMIQLSISDDGIGIAKDMDIRNTRSLGLHLVTALSEGQLHGKIILNRESGTEFQISFGAK